jgi:putative endonuclease
MAYYVYITTNPAKAVLYIGVTNDLARRLAQHYENRGNNETFAGRYFCYNLLYTEQFANIKEAISREKELKGWTRAKKDSLIATVNPNWDSLTL